MAKTPTDIRSLARGHTQTAINVLAGIMSQTDAPASSRVAAAEALLNRGWGKPTQPHSGADGEELPAFKVILVDASETD
jgi:hypothetical protein